MNKKPFTLVFGKKPLQFISRLPQTNSIIEDFRQEPSVSMVYMLTGIRGSGKTVMMTIISQELAKDSDWIVEE